MTEPGLSTIWCFNFDKDVPNDFMAYFFLLKQLWHYSGTHRWKLALAILCHVLSLSAALLTPYVFAQILNTLQTQEHQAILPLVTRWTLIWVALSVWFNVFHRLGRYFEFDIGFRARQNFTNHFYYIVTHLPLRWHADHHSGDTINRINTAGGALGSFGCNQYTYINLFITFWGPLVALTILSWRIAGVSLIIMLMTMPFIRYFDTVLVRLYGLMNELQHKIAATFFDYISNIRTIITLRVIEKTAEELNARQEAFYPPYMRAETWINGWKWFFVSVSSTGLQVGVVFYYVWLQVRKNDKILVGNAAAVFQYVSQFSESCSSFARQYQQIIQWKTNFEAALPILDAYQPHSHVVPYDRTDWQTVTLQDLSFSYQADRLTLDKISLSFKRGEKIALVGTSGAGKSSVMNILRGLYQPTEITVSVDGLENSNLTALHETTTLIPQDPEIFENTILFNITMGADYAPSLVNTVIALAKFDDVLAKLPRGLETDMREKGVTLSGGEKQRLALARGLLAAENSSLILMDEPTSSVDMANEKAIYNAIFKHFSDRTIISSVHRVSLLPLFDRIIVMEHGQIMEQGSYAELTTNPTSHFASFLQRLENDDTLD